MKESRDHISIWLHDVVIGLFINRYELGLPI